MQSRKRRAETDAEQETRSYKTPKITPSDKAETPEKNTDFSVNAGNIDDFFPSDYNFAQNNILYDFNDPFNLQISSTDTTLFTANNSQSTTTTVTTPSHQDTLSEIYETIDQAALKKLSEKITIFIRKECNGRIHTDGKNIIEFFYSTKWVDWEKSKYCSNTGLLLLAPTAEFGRTIRQCKQALKDKYHSYKPTKKRKSSELYMLIVKMNRAPKDNDCVPIQFTYQFKNIADAYYNLAHVFITGKIDSSVSQLNKTAAGIKEQSYVAEIQQQLSQLQSQPPLPQPQQYQPYQLIQPQLLQNKQYQQQQFQPQQYQWIQQPPLQQPYEQQYQYQQYQQQQLPLNQPQNDILNPNTQNQQNNFTFNNNFTLFSAGSNAGIPNLQYQSNNNFQPG